MQEVGPHECVPHSVGHLIDAEIKWPAKVETDEVVGACLVEHLYFVLGAERADMCRRAKPSQPH